MTTIINNNEIDLIESLCKILNKHELDSLEYNGIKITKSKHKPKPVITEAPAKRKKKTEEPTPSTNFLLTDDEAFFSDPYLYMAVE